MAKILDDMDELYEKIYSYRVDIASHKRDKIERRATAWADASDIKLAKEKEDFVRSVVAEVQEKIDFCEAEIERAYNRLKLYEWKLENDNEQ